MDTLIKINGNEYLTLALTNESKEKLKNYGVFWIKIRDLIRLIIENSDDYDDKYVKIKFNSDDELHLNKVIETLTVTLVVRDIFLENNEYYPYVFLHECQCII